jgi:hypothetical protein
MPPLHPPPTPKKACQKDNDPSGTLGRFLKALSRDLSALAPGGIMLAPGGWRWPENNRPVKHDILFVLERMTGDDSNRFRVVMIFRNLLGRMCQREELATVSPGSLWFNRCCCCRRVCLCVSASDGGQPRHGPRVSSRDAVLLPAQDAVQELLDAQGAAPHCNTTILTSFLLLSRRTCRWRRSPTRHGG